MEKTNRSDRGERRHEAKAGREKAIDKNSKRVLARANKEIMKHALKTAVMSDDLEREREEARKVRIKRLRYRAIFYKLWRTSDKLLKQLILRQLEPGALDHLLEEYVVREDDSAFDDSDDDNPFFDSDDDDDDGLPPSGGGTGAPTMIV